jgi:hypothetical protein
MLTGIAFHPPLCRHHSRACLSERGGLLVPNPTFGNSTAPSPALPLPLASAAPLRSGPGSCPAGSLLLLSSHAFFLTDL